MTASLKSNEGRNAPQTGSVFDANCSARDALELISSKWGLVIREDHRSIPLHVDYHLSTLGRSLSDALVVLGRWAERNFPEPDAARERYDRASGTANGR
jgi:DNA-binding HxlR family transcriptional regulator